MTNKDLLNVVKEHGSPVYVYDASVITGQYKRLTDAFKKVKQLRLNYAVKALNNISILQHLHSLGSGIDTVSVQEVKLGMLAGFTPDRIIFTPNGVSLEEIEQVAEMGVQINIDNLSILEQFGTKHPSTPVCIRVNPHVMAGGNANISVGHIDSKFGISIHQLPHVLRIVENTGMNINGVHMHTGSDILDIDVFIHATEILFETAKKFENLEFIDFGSGFKVPYKEGDIETNIEEMGEKLSVRFNAFAKAYGKPLTPMLYGSQHEIHNISNPKGKERFYSVVGYICETDTFATNRRISEISEGDILAFENAGAYCFTMASNYNSRYRPAEVLWKDGQAHLIRKRETFEDLIANQVPLKQLTKA